VGKGKRRRMSDSLMNLAKSSYQQGEMMEEDQRSIIIIGGIELFLPTSLFEARVCVADATTESQPVATVIKEERKKILKSSPQEEEEENSTKLLRIFIQGY
jgi:hypothetical protein